MDFLEAWRASVLFSSVFFCIQCICVH